MRILILGGIAEAKTLATTLRDTHGHDIIYSIAGIGRNSVNTPSWYRIGGFGGVPGLIEYLKHQRIDRVIDTTHPYAAQISQHAWQACQETGIELWAYCRPSWSPEAEDQWVSFNDWQDLTEKLKPYHRPFFSIGSLPFSHSDEIPPHQEWLVRALRAPTNRPLPNHLTVIEDIGPFKIYGELALLKQYKIDIIVSKNSGTTAVAAKLQAVRQLGLPVLMQHRPTLPEVSLCFDNIHTLLTAFR